MRQFPKFNIDVKSKTSNLCISTVTISPLSRGFGNTLGNSLRRVLLGFIPGASVFAVKINSLSHEFTAIDGIMEDVSQIILNIKKLVLSIDEGVFGQEELEEKTISEWPSLKLNADKKGVVYAKDIVCPAGIKVVNGDMKICELTEDVPLEVEMYASVDIGYRSFAENREMLNTLKIIAIDSMFSPITKVEWKVVEEKTTKEETTDKLILTVATDGSIKALDALSLAAQTLISFLSPIAELNSEIAAKNLIGDKDRSRRKFATTSSVEVLNLSAASSNFLKEQGINTLLELTDRSEADLGKVKKSILQEIKEKLSEHKLKLRDS